MTRNAMDESGVAFAWMSTDEALPYVFLNGPGGIVGYEEYDRPRLCALFADAYERANPDMQQEKIGYPATPAGKANLSMCTNAVAARYNCPAYTLEMPFKDNANAPDESMGWSPQRSEARGQAPWMHSWALAQAMES